MRVLLFFNILFMFINIAVLFYIINKNKSANRVHDLDNGGVVIKNKKGKDLVKFENELK